MKIVVISYFLIIAFLEIQSQNRPSKINEIFAGNKPNTFFRLEDDHEGPSNKTQFIDIIGGEEVYPHAHPYLIILENTDYFGDYVFSCGGLIYDEYHIITAGHCVIGSLVGNLQIVAGDHNITAEEGTEQFKCVEAFYIHQSFNVFTLDYDIAVIRLTKPLTFNKYVQPISIVGEGFVPKGKCKVTGWGSTGNNYLSQVLHETSLDIVQRDECAQRYSTVGPVTDRMICGGGNSKGSCSGDSGGPLICRDDEGKSFLAGLVSWGVIPCGQDKYPSVFTNLAYFYEWLSIYLP